VAFVKNGELAVPAYIVSSGFSVPALFKGLLMNYFLLAAFWFLSIFGVCFLTHEFTVIKHKMDREAMNGTLQKCIKIIAEE